MSLLFGWVAVVIVGLGVVLAARHLVLVVHRGKSDTDLVDWGPAGSSWVLGVLGFYLAGSAISEQSIGAIEHTDFVIALAVAAWGYASPPLTWKTAVPRWCLLALVVVAGLSAGAAIPALGP